MFNYSTPDEVILAALQITEQRAYYAQGPAMDSPIAVKQHFRLRLAHLEHEVVSIMFLDAQHKVIETIDMFRGTLAQATVHPREIVKKALSLNAGAIVMAHNHPSGIATPSRADELLTQTIKSALALVDIRVLDHIVVGATESVSFAERGIL